MGLKNQIGLELTYLLEYVQLVCGDLQVGGDVEKIFWNKKSVCVFNVIFAEKHESEVVSWRNGVQVVEITILRFVSTFWKR